MGIITVKWYTVFIKGGPYVDKGKSRKEVAERNKVDISDVSTGANLRNTPSISTYKRTEVKPE